MDFPRGLAQPESGHRFGLDSLLLACLPGLKHASRVKPARVLDLGAGCGVVGLGLLLRAPERNLRVLGLELSATMAACARENARRLGQEERFHIVRADVAEPLPLPAESFDLALCNPPYHSPERGRLPPDANAETLAGRFQIGIGLASFVAAAAKLLKAGGKACFVYPAPLLAELLVTLEAHELAPKRLILVHGREGKPAKLALAEGVKGGGPSLTVEPPLILHGQGREYTPQALAFCPFLACNAHPCSPA